MPELPEVETTCRGITPFLLNKSILKIDTLDSRLRWPVSPEFDQVSNLNVTSIRRRAKYIIIDLPKNNHILLHLGMSGSLIISPADEPLKKHDHLVFHLENQLQMRYHDPRRFGCALWINNDVEAHPLLAKLGPEPLSPEFTPEYLHNTAKNRNTAIKLHIMNNHHVVGVGNIYACEALFNAGISPKKAATKLTKPKAILLHQAIQSVLEKSIKQGGTTLRDFVNSNGQPGYFKQQLNVYDRENLPCLTCDTPIKKITQGQRSTFYCPSCQR